MDSEASHWRLKKARVRWGCIWAHFVKLHRLCRGILPQSGFLVFKIIEGVDLVLFLLRAPFEIKIQREFNAVVTKLT